MFTAVGTATARLSMPTRAAGSGAPWTGAAGRSADSRRLSALGIWLPSDSPGTDSRRDSGEEAPRAEGKPAPAPATAGVVDAAPGTPPAVVPSAGAPAVIRRATAAVRLATRPPCRARKPAGALNRRAGAEPVPDAAASGSEGAWPAPAAGSDERRTEAAGTDPEPFDGTDLGPFDGTQPEPANEIAPGPFDRNDPDPVDGTGPVPGDGMGLALGAASAPAADRGAAVGCTGSARRIAMLRRSAVTGPGAESGALALPVPAAAGPRPAEPRPTAGPAAAERSGPPGAAKRSEVAGLAAGGRRAAVARDTDRRRAAAIPPPLCWETAPALAARADVGSPPPAEFPGGAEPNPERDVPAARDERPAEEPAVAGGAGRGACSRRCSCELVIGPAAVTSSIRRTGIAVETRPPAILPGERGWSSVGTCRAARANPRGGSVGTAGVGPGAPDSSAAPFSPGVHQRGGRISACPSERADTVAAAASARRTATGRAVAAANRLEEAATSPGLAARDRPAGRPGRRSRWAAARPSAVRSTSPAGVGSIVIGSSTGNRDGPPRVAPAAPRCWPS